MPSISIQFHPQLNCVCIRKCPGIYLHDCERLNSATCCFKLMKWNGASEDDGDKQSLRLFCCHLLLCPFGPLRTSFSLSFVVAILDNYRPFRYFGSKADQEQSIKTFRLWRCVIMSCCVSLRRSFILLGQMCGNCKNCFFALRIRAHQGAVKNDRKASTDTSHVSSPSGYRLFV